MGDCLMAASPRGAFNFPSEQRGRSIFLEALSSHKLHRVDTSSSLKNFKLPNNSGFLLWKRWIDIRMLSTLGGSCRIFFRPLAWWTRWWTSLSNEFTPILEVLYWASTECTVYFQGPMFHVSTLWQDWAEICLHIQPCAGRLSSDIHYPLLSHAICEILAASSKSGDVSYE